MKKSILAISILILTIFAISSSLILLSGDEKSNQNTALVSQIEQKIKKNKKITIDHLIIKEKEPGEIVLEGIADLFGEKYYAQKAAESFPIKKLENDIVVRPSQMVNDTDLQRDLFEGIKRELRGSYFDDVSFKVTNGVVQLFGKIVSVGALNKIFEMAIWTPGVRYVENNLKMVSASPQDDKIRNNLYYRLASDMRTKQYFVGSSPSIILAVESGKITLKGYVTSKIDKIIIGQLANSLVGVISVDNQLETPEN